MPENSNVPAGTKSRVTAHSTSIVQDSRAASGDQLLSDLLGKLDHIKERLSSETDTINALIGGIGGPVPAPSGDSAIPPPKQLARLQTPQDSLHLSNFFDSPTSKKH